MGKAVVCQISRGLSPARAISQASLFAQRLGLTYILIDTETCVDAKNSAVKWALSMGKDLLLLEDDVMLPWQAWKQAVEQRRLAYAEVIMQNGQINTQRKADGEFLFTGTIFVYIPLKVLKNLPDPAFKAQCFKVENDQLIPTTPTFNGKHSDVYFWWQISKLGIKPVNLGKATHILHPLQGVHNQPSELEYR